MYHIYSAIRGGNPLSRMTATWINKILTEQLLSVECQWLNMAALSEYRTLSFHEVTCKVTKTYGYRVSKV